MFVRNLPKWSILKETSGCFSLASGKSVRVNPSKERRSLGGKLMKFHLRVCHVGSPVTAAATRSPGGPPSGREMTRVRIVPAWSAWSAWPAWPAVWSGWLAAASSSLSPPCGGRPRPADGQAQEAVNLPDPRGQDADAQSGAGNRVPAMREEQQSLQAPDEAGADERRKRWRRRLYHYQ